MKKYLYIFISQIAAAISSEMEKPRNLRDKIFALPYGASCDVFGRLFQKYAENTTNTQ